MNIQDKFVASMRGIAIDSINNAKGGHMGMAIGAANITYSLIAQSLKFDQYNPKWINRDRFILSSGHGSMSYYSVMHFLGLLSKEQMQKHKTLHSQTPSHPEIDAYKYVDATTGPLGQGIAMGVGMAIAQKYLSNRYNRKNYKIIDHDVFVLHGDGCLQEGVALEAIQLAGTLKLNKLILIHDYNDVQIDSYAYEVNNINLLDYFKANKFSVFEVRSDKPEAILEAIAKAKESQLPSYIQVHTQIAYKTPVANTSKGHNGTLDENATLKFKKNLGLNNKEPFEYDEEVYQFGNQLMRKKDLKVKRWNKLFEQYCQEFPKESQELLSLINNQIKYDFSNIKFEKDNLAIRDYFPVIMEHIETNYPFVLGGSADLKSATKVGFSNEQNIKYGIREFAMSAINNGINLYSNFKTIDSTFLAFADYAKPALRLGSIMNLGSIHIYTHDSYQVGGDGPTHQPVEQLAMLRSIPNLKVYRPADENDLINSFNQAFNDKHNQSVIIATRQSLKSFKRCNVCTYKSAYLVKDIYGKFDLTLLTSGSEVQLAYEVAQKLDKMNIKTRVINVLCLQDLIHDDNLITNLELNHSPLFAIEASADNTWYRLAKYNKFDAFLADGFGYSADGQEVYELKGFNADNILEKIQKFLQ